jgi:hypothetical protein
LTSDNELRDALNAALPRNPARLLVALIVAVRPYPAAHDALVRGLIPLLVGPRPTSTDDAPRSAAPDTKETTR